MSDLFRINDLFENYFRVILLIFPILFFPNKIEAFQEKNKFNGYVDQFYESISDSAVAAKYAKKYIDLAKKQKDTTKIMNGYYFFSILTKHPVSLIYSDSILDITKRGNHRSEDYPALAYVSKAINYYENGDFQNALDNFLLVNQESEKYNNRYLSYTTKNSIAILKSRIGENATALKLLKESFFFFTQEKENYPDDYLETLFALSDSYTRNKKLDSASILNSLGYKESLTLNNKKMTIHFRLNEGVNQYHLANYRVAKDSIIESIRDLKYIDDLANSSIAHYYLGKTFLSLNTKEKAIDEFIKMDSIVQQIKEIMPETREGYEILINHFKKEKDKDNQLEYIEKLLKVDSILNKNYKYLVKNIEQKYDTPLLISEKEGIIHSLKQSKKNLFGLIYLSMLYA